MDPIFLLIVILIQVTTSLEEDNLVPSEPKCSTSFAIENGNLKNGPVCAIDVSDRSMLSFTAETSTDSLNDRDLNSCIWFKRGDMLAVKFPEKYHFVRATLVSQASHKERLRSSEWSLVVIKDDEFVKHAGGGSFQETGALNQNDWIPGVRWNLNNTGDTIQLALHNGNVYLCEIFIHSYPQGVPLEMRRNNQGVFNDPLADEPSPMKSPIQSKAGAHWTGTEVFYFSILLVIGRLF